MNNITLEEIANNVSGNIVLFPPVEKGMIKFEIKDKIKIVNGMKAFLPLLLFNKKNIMIKYFI